LTNRKKQEKPDISLDPSILNNEKFQEFLKFQSIYEKVKSKEALKQLKEEKFQEFLKFQSIYEKIESKDLIKLQDEILIPTSIFNEELSALETICKYLKENLNFTNKKISFFTNKSSKSIWQAYNNSKKKLSSKFQITPSKYFIPISILRTRKSILGSIILFLKDELNLSYSEVGILLKRDQRTIWTIYNREKHVK